VPYQQQIADILAAWRKAERRRDATSEGSAEREVAAAEVARLRDEYQRVVRLQTAAIPPDLAGDHDAGRVS
jgi:hypothetical protein